MRGLPFVKPLPPSGYAILGISAPVIGTDPCISSMNGSTSTDVILIWVTAANQTVLVARHDHSSTRILGRDSYAISREPPRDHDSTAVGGPGTPDTMARLLTVAETGRVKGVLTSVLPLGNHWSAPAGASRR